MAQQYLQNLRPRRQQPDPEQEQKQQHPHGPPSEQRTSFPPLCPICLDTLPSPKNMAKFLPCNHTFNLVCAITLLTSPPGVQSRQCPLCRHSITSVQYDFSSTLSSSSTCSTHIPGSSMPNSGPFIRPDEAVREDMLELEKYRRRELRRLRLLEDYEPPEWRLYHMGCLVKEGDKVIFVERQLSLRVARRLGDNQIATTALLSRSLTIKVFNAVDISVGILNTLSSSEDVDAARKEVRALLDDLGTGKHNRAWLDWENLNLGLDHPEYVILRDDKGLEVAAKKSLAIVRKFTDNIKITQYTTLSEIYPFKVPSNWANPDYEANIINGKEKATRLRAICLARQEIQGAFNLFKTIPEHKVQDLDAGCSSILNPIKQEDLECEYCDAKHRNGDCKIPDLTEL